MAPPHAGGGRLRLTGNGLDAGQKAGKPGALHGIGRTDDAIEEIDVLLTERCRLWNGRGNC
jgi:hypothetical protein